MKDFQYTNYNPGNRKRARTLRRDMTPHERKLWYCFLKDYPVRFYRQRPIGDYIVDFYCSQAKLILELDGSQHYTEEGETSDTKRTQALSALGLRVLRFSNLEIDQKFPAVCTAIDNAVQAAF